MRLADVIISPEKEGKEKHVPVIEAPAKVKKGQRFEVKVTVGKQVAHPNTIEHHIAWVKLYGKEDGARPVFEIAAASFGPTLGEPIVTFTCMLPKSTTLIATELCNVHGIWDNSAKVEVEE